MAFTAEQEAEFKREFSTRRRRQLIMTVPFIVVVLLMIFLRRSQSGELFGVPITTLGPILFVLVICALFFSWRNWRCPACDKYLGRTLSPKFCARCGVTLQ